jgi:phage-related protein
MDPKFEVIFLEEAIEFLESLEEKEREKIIYNIDKSRFVNDQKLFKKLTESIWEFRTRFNKTQFRLFAFWDKREEQQTLVVSTHGLVKKTNKIPKKELEKAERIMEEYFTEE